MYDADALSALITKAIGKRTQKAFAEEIEISETHLSRIIRRYFSYPPRKSTLKKIALHSEGRVSLDELLLVCGYYGDISETSLDSDAANAQAFHFFEATLLAALKKMNIPWTLEPSEDPGYDLMVSFQSPYDFTWKFKYLIPKDRFNESVFYLETLKLLITDPDADGNMISIVTNDAGLFDKCSSQSPVNLALDLSIILIDQDNLMITKEKTLSNTDRLNAYAKKLIPNRVCK
jgi:transcriptional regulator with XRE-family HTH domain